MIVSVIRPDSCVIVDGVAASVDCSELPAFIHAIQWNSDAGRGHIEFAPDSDGRRNPNMPITDFTAYGYLCDRHREARASAAIRAKEAELGEVEKKARDAKALAEQDAQMQAALVEMQARTEVALAEKRAADDRITRMEAQLAELENKIAQKNAEFNLHV